MKYSLLACSILLFGFLLSCAPFGSTVQPQPKQLTVVQQIIQQNKDSIRSISNQINQDYQIGYRTHKLITQVQPESDLHYKQLGKIVQSIVKQVQQQANKTKTQHKDRARTAAVAVVTIVCLCAIGRSCKRGKGYMQIKQRFIKLMAKLGFKLMQNKAVRFQVIRSLLKYLSRME